MPRASALDRNQSLLERFEEREARRVAAAYNQARREIVDLLITRWSGSATMTPGEAAALLRQLGLLEQIDGRLLELEQVLGDIVWGVVTSSTEMAIDQLRRELDLLPPTLRPDNVATFGTINHRMVERFVPVAMGDMRLATQSLSLTIRRELQTGLIQGESFDKLVRRVMAPEATGPGPAVWRNGALSAERAVRRLVITAENGAKQESIGEVAKAVPEVQKQAVAVIGQNTTDCCLRVHGQIQPVSEPFELEGTPRFADEMMTPAFHWNCRTSIAMWHPLFERSGLTTANMRSSAQAELRKREGKKEGTA